MTKIKCIKDSILVDNSTGESLGVAFTEGKVYDLDMENESCVDDLGESHGMNVGDSWFYQHFMFVVPSTGTVEQLVQAAREEERAAFARELGRVAALSMNRLTLPRAAELYFRAVGGSIEQSTAAVRVSFIKWRAKRTKEFNPQ